MKKRWQKFAGLCVLLLAVYAAVDLLSDIYLQQTTYTLEVKPKKSFHKSMYIPSYRFKLKDGSECKGIFWIRNLDTEKPKITARDLHCTNYFILNARLPDFRDSMEIGKDYQKEYNKHIPGMPGTPGIP